MPQRTTEAIQEHTSQPDVQPRKRAEESPDTRTHDADPLKRIISGIGDDGCVAKHATVIQRTGLFHPMNQRQKVQSLLRLQKLYGNRFVQRVIAQHVIQTKMQVSQPGDAYEQEADRVAEAVMSMPEPQTNEGAAVSGQTQDTSIQRLCPACEQKLHRQPMEEEEAMRAKEVSGKTSEVTPNLEARINTRRGSGQSLPESTRAFFEPRFGYDFSGVQVHTDAESDTFNHALNARAFTTSQNIFFRQGTYDPGSSSGRELLAHELTHVVQQMQGRVNPTMQAKLTVGPPDDAYEKEADKVAETVMRMPEPAMQEDGETTVQAKPISSQLQRARAVRVPANSEGPRIQRICTERKAIDALAHRGTREREADHSGGELLTHMMQQRSASTQAAAPQQQVSRSPDLWISSDAPWAVQRKPHQVTAHRFLGLNIRGGVNPTLASRLNDVAARLRRDYQVVHGAPAANDTDVRNWAGINSMSGWRQRSRPSRSKHCSGSAVDVNYYNQPYIVTRSQVGSREVLGGERAGRGLTAQRQATVDVFDRAKEFVFGQINIVVPIGMPFVLIPFSISLPNRADVSERRAGESTGDVFDRFKETSNALGTYLGLAFDTAPDRVRRRPIRNIETASEAALLRAIPTTERKTEAAGIADIRAYIRAHLTTVGTGPTFHFSTGNVGQARNFYFRMLRDYEHVRIPMVRGNPVARPGNTRNPARGFLDMSREFVVAMADVGRLRWGIADLGSAESGDTHHFDLGNHGGVTPDCLP